VRSKRSEGVSRRDWGGVEHDAEERGRALRLGWLRSTVVAGWDMITVDKIHRKFPRLRLITRLQVLVTRYGGRDEILAQLIII
jgi:hypothetical protein